MIAVRIERYDFPDELLYDRQHNWARMEEGLVVQGMTAYAWQLAGQALYVELPRLGRQVEQREQLTTVETAAGVVRMRAAVSGEIVAVNQRLQEEVGLIHEHPYDQGWVVKIRPSQPQELQQLKRPDDPVFHEWFLLSLSGELSRQLGGPEYAVLALHRDLEQAYHRLETLYEVARATTSTLDLDQVLRTVVQRTTEVFDAKGCSIRLLDASEQTLEIATAWGLSDRYLLKGQVELQNSPIDRLALQGEPVIVGDVAADPRFQYPEEIAQEGICSILCCPLIVRAKAAGVIRVYSAARDRFGEKEADLLKAIANGVAVAIANAMAYRELAEIDRAKSQFVLMVTHELRAPVATVQSLLRVISGGYAGDIPPRQKELVERAERRTMFLQQLVDDLLDLAAGKAQRLAEASHEVAVNPLVTKVADHLRPVAEGKTQELLVSMPPEELRVQATSDGLERVLANLIGNAIKYTPAGGRVEVALECQDRQVCLVVRDNGIGIPPEAQPHLFEEFFRAANAKAVEREGTGLGLSIVKSLVERYDGRITVASTVGQGTVFRVFLPLLFGPGQ